MIERKSSEIKEGDITSFGKIIKIEKSKRKNWLKFTYINKFSENKNITSTTEWPKTEYIKLQLQDLPNDST